MPSRASSVLWTQRFERSPEPNLSLQAQIRQMLVASILDGQLMPGHALPSSRELADQLGVARNTVVLAYQQLVEEGYLISRERSGHFVNPATDELQRGFTAAGVAETSSIETQQGHPDWSARIRHAPSHQRNIVKPSNWQSYEYPFIYGQFDTELFPTSDWRESCMHGLSVMEIRNWAPDLIERDDESLIQQIRTRVLPRRGVFAMPEYGDTMTSVARHSTLTAYITRIVCRRTGSDAELSFICGLLHDVGFAGLLLAVSHIEGASAPDLRLLWNDVDRLHEQATLLLTQRWGLPAEVVEVVGHHHHLHTGPFSRTAAAVHLADHLTQHFGASVQGPLDQGVPLPGDNVGTFELESACAELGLDDAGLKQILAEAERTIPEIVLL